MKPRKVLILSESEYENFLKNLGNKELSESEQRRYRRRLALAKHNFKRAEKTIAQFEKDLNQQ